MLITIFTHFITQCSSLAKVKGSVREKCEGGKWLTAKNNRFWLLLILFLSVASIRRKLIKTTFTEAHSVHTNSDLLTIYECVEKNLSGSFHVKSTTYGRHVTDFAEILHTIWDMKKNAGTRRWAFWDLRGRRYGSGKFPIIRDFEAGLYISNGSDFFVLKDSSKIFSVLNR